MKEIPGYQVDEVAAASTGWQVWGFVPTAIQENISELYSGPVLTY